MPLKTIKPRPVPTRNNTNRAVPHPGWHLSDVDEVCGRLLHLGVEADDADAFLSDLARRNARNPRRFTEKLSDDALLSDVRNSVAAQALPAYGRRQRYVWEIDPTGNTVAREVGRGRSSLGTLADRDKRAGVVRNA